MDTQLFVRNALATLFIYAAFLFLLYRKNTKHTRQLWNLIGSVVFCVLMSAITAITGLTPLSGFHTDIRLNEINWDAWGGFIDMVNAGGSWGFLNLIGNILLFIPVGFFLPLLCLKTRHPLKVIFSGFFLSLLIETWQLFLSRGTDTTDLVLNTLGAVAGYLIYLIFSILFPKFTARFSSVEKAAIKKQKKEVRLAIFLPIIVTIGLGFIDRAIYFANGSAASVTVLGSAILSRFLS